MKTVVCLAALVFAPLLCLSAEPAAKDQPTKRVAFAQYCFWTGEMQLGQIDGVVRTEAGYFQGREVTLVDFDPSRISLEQLAHRAKAAGVGERLHLSAAATVVGGSIGGVSVGAPLDGSYRTAPASDQKKQIEGTPYAGLKLTPEQATKVNAFVRVDLSKAREWLTGAQREQIASAR
ncbi:MAG TPA: hypothetical protein VGF73_00275 [Chthoniobacterales bacterium]